MATTRPIFIPKPCLMDNYHEPLQFNDGTKCIPVCFCPVTFPLELFELAATQLVEHPEYNSTLILRSETLSECHLDSDKPLEIPRIEGYRFLKNVSRKLLPRRPARDMPIDQHCSFYSSHNTSEVDNVPPASCVVLTPIVSPGESMPYYHPTVSHLAFRYLQFRPDSFSTVGEDNDSFPQIGIEVVPLLHSSDPKEINSRLYRTCLALLETIHRYGWGAMTNYKKRVIHDYIIPRDVYQDLYLVMRERHKHLIQEWKEETDPLKHVFEDIGIATFLILLWKDMYQSGYVHQNVAGTDAPPWFRWPRPPGGFLDLGCGNGLLTHILISEGYVGEGIDVRARTSWSYYTPSTQEHLHTYSLNPTSVSILKDTPEYSTAVNNDYFKAGTFIIANHADELTPWTPILSTLCSASGYLSIPCCAWSFDSKFERSTKQPLFTSLQASSSDSISPEFIESLNLGGDGSNSSTYALYRIWLASLSLHCGWEVECETLRIPSTRNWALIGRKRSQNVDGHDSIRNCMEIVAKVQERGLFKPRRPEGKAGEH